MPSIRLPILIMLWAVSASAHAQQKVERIGFLLAIPNSAQVAASSVDAFREQMRSLGYVEGRNLVIDFQRVESPQQLQALAAELVKRNPSVIVSDGSPSTAALQRATKTIPIVMAVSAAPDRQGFVETLAHPGGNITGMTMLLPEMAAKRLELLKELLPNATRVAVLRGPGSPFQWEAAEAAASRLKIKLQLIEYGADPDYEDIMNRAAQAKADAILPLAHAIVVRDAAQIASSANKHRLPTMFFERTAVDAGGLMSYGQSIPDLFRGAAVYVDRILKGASPAELPVEASVTFDLFINYETAKAIGVTIPQSLRLRSANQ